MEEKPSMEPLTEERVEHFLMNHEDFLAKFYEKHGSKEMIEKMTGKKSLDVKNITIVKSDTFAAECPMEHVKRKSVAPAGPGKPLGGYQSAQRNSVTTSMFKQYVEGQMKKMKKASLVQNIVSLRKLNEQELFMELIRDIATELDVNVLCHKILQNVSILTKSDRGSLFLVRGNEQRKYLVSKLFDVTRTSTPEESIHTEENEIKVPFGRGIAGHVAETKGTINIKEAYDDPRFNQDVDKKTGYRTHSILCMPILSYDDELVGVAQIINKVEGPHEFTKQDEEYFRRYLIFCGIGITNAQLFEMSVQEYKRNQLLLNLARGVFEEQTSLEKLLQKIILQSQDLLKCERCLVYLLDDVLDKNVLTGLFAKVMEKYINHKQLQWAFNKDADSPKEDYKRPTSTKEVVFCKAFDLCAKDGGTIHVPSVASLSKSKNAEIARHVVVQGMPLNIGDMDESTTFGKGPHIDEDGFRSKSMLCMPIYNSDKKIIGVTQLINKINGQAFIESDANIIEAFSIFTGLGIHNCQMYENACKLMAKQSVALEVLSYHATAQASEIDELLTCEIPSAEKINLYSFGFNDIPMPDDDTVKAVVCMFQEADLFNKFRIPYDVLCRWATSVKKNYRPVTYHNWRHAFNVAQTMFTMIYTGGLKPMFKDIEVLTLLVGCLCHDLDHRGTNNAFQVKVVSPLAMLYSTSVMEHHHFDHCIMILNSEGNNIFQSLSSEEYRTVIKMLEHAILSTDLALYFKKRGDFKTLIDNGDIKFETEPTKELLRAMMMTACDVAAITKPWEIQKEVAQLVANEFFEQGDIEKDKLGEKPIAMMDREKVDELPKMQVGFIDAICIPVYKMFSELWGGLQPMYNGCVYNRNQWQDLADKQNALESPSKVTSTEPEKPAPTNNSSQEQKTQNGGVRKTSTNNQPKRHGSNVISKKTEMKSYKKTKICSLM
ncbi:cGMP-specific 3',5'-cyclic phosphodiesterase-like isoform X2 [Pecten maximus]|uniref:cGMP-specific 3',5'-cyclic phosphodiesterase-like isoform X2 n=1 Tax=Pecten maximus TaxID=6579 RepID=UPI001457E854|nr:cGMP-specific 3',5'-cyclic phosphodiesterase-like isoform X2 [Pecten maximus]